jgi:transposase
MDETGLELDYSVWACWMKRGQQKKVPLNSTDKQHTYLIGAYDWNADRVTVQPAHQLNRHTIIDFLKHLLTEVYPTEGIVLVLDNASFHRARDTQAYLALFEHRVRIVWLPKYAPRLNLIERFWQHLKKIVCAHRLYPDI